ncbi:MAG: BrnT family toxin [Spirochaetales bacterium]|nr:BrnT family toxin [Spirochaetales bacterium]
MEINKKKHGIDFADAVGVFEDEWALTIKEQIIDREQRFVSIGMDFVGRVILVVYTSRKATRNERKIYEQRRI